MKACPSFFYECIRKLWWKSWIKLVILLKITNSTIKNKKRKRLNLDKNVYRSHGIKKEHGKKTT